MSSPEGTAFPVAGTPAFLPATIAYLLVLLLAVALNLTVLVVIRYQTRLQDNMRLLYQILAVLDIVLGVLWSLWSLFWFSFKDERSCTLITLVFTFPSRVVFFSVMVILCAISFNLYLLVSRPLRYHLVVTPTRLRRLLIVALLTVLLVCGMYVPIPSSPLMALMTSECKSLRLGVKPNWPSIIQMTLVTSSVSLTLTFTTIVTLNILKIAYKKARDIHAMEMRLLTTLRLDPSPAILGPVGHHRMSSHALGVVEVELVARQLHDRLHNSRIRKQLVTVLLLTGSFCIAWTPWMINFSLDFGGIWVFVLDVIAVSSTWIQPIVYLLTNEEARRICHNMFLSANN